MELIFRGIDGEMSTVMHMYLLVRLEFACLEIPHSLHAIKFVLCFSRNFNILPENPASGKCQRTQLIRQSCHEVLSLCRPCPQLSARHFDACTSSPLLAHSYSIFAMLKCIGISARRQPPSHTTCKRFETATASGRQNMTRRVIG